MTRGHVDGLTPFLPLGIVVGAVLLSVDVRLLGNARLVRYHYPPSHYVMLHGKIKANFVASYSACKILVSELWRFCLYQQPARVARVIL